MKFMNQPSFASDMIQNSTMITKMPTWPMMMTTVAGTMMVMVTVGEMMNQNKLTIHLHGKLEKELSKS
jgi:uncharacterized Fe-S center protein